MHALGGLALGLFWLLLLGAYQRFDAPAALVFVAAVLGAFCTTHLWRRWPPQWHYGRLRGFDPAHLAPAFATLLLLTAAQIGLLVLFGEPATPAANANTAWLLPLIAVLAAPLIEEFGFRLWLQSPLEAVLPVWLALFIAATVFTLVHGTQTWYSHLLSGLLYGYALLLSGSIWLPVLLHAGSNAVIAALDTSTTLNAVLAHWAADTGATQLWIGTGLVALLLAAALAMGRYWYQRALSLRRIR